MTNDRTPLVAGNWKMNKNVTEARVLVSEMLPSLQQINGVTKVICPPFMALHAVRALLQGTEIGLGAQNIYWEKSGAYTGEISPYMISEFCDYVIIGHSERRQFFGETNKIVNQKVKAALSYGLVPIMCVGESLSENENGLTTKIVSEQLLEGLSGITSVDIAEKNEQDFPGIIIAYEPVWAIGTGRAATSEEAERIISNAIRQPLIQLFGDDITKRIRVLYGGSVNSENAKEFFQRSEIDGALVGGASLKSEEFIKIVKAASL